MKVQFIRDTLIKRVTYTPAAGAVEIADDVARRCIERRQAVAAVPPPAETPVLEAPTPPKPKAKS